MAELTAFLITESTQNIVRSGSNDSVQQLTGPLIALRPQFIPSNFSFSVTFGIRGIDLEKQNILKLTLKRPSGSILHDLGNVQFPPIHNKDSLPLTYSGFVGGIDFRNLALDEEGCYKLEIYVNGQLVSVQDIPVYKRGS